MTTKARTPKTKPARRRGEPHFATGGSEEFRVPPSDSTPKRVFVICHYCGYSPEGDVPADGVCPKCGRYSWERFALAEPLLPEHMKKK